MVQETASIYAFVSHIRLVAMSKIFRRSHAETVAFVASGFQWHQQTVRDRVLNHF